jgi:hypothetical protein
MQERAAPPKIKERDPESGKSHQIAAVVEAP